MSRAEAEYFSQWNWTLNRDTFEWVHVLSGLGIHDLWLFMEHYESH